MIFHLAFPIDDIGDARDFYVGVLGCSVGRESERWIDFDFFGHQISAHVSPAECAAAREASSVNPVDGDQVPVRHFGCVLEWSEWERMAERLRAADVPFLIDPRVRFAGKAGEQGTFFVRDPAGNALEFKTFREMSLLFQRD
ncbi:MAG: extradiol dioxygenase family protein [Planctomycetota bacterium]